MSERFVQFALLRRSDPGAGLEFIFDTDTCPQVVLGRDPSCQVSLDPQRDSIAGIFHARIERDPNSPSGLIVIDMDSRNGIYVDGVRVRGQAILPPNSSLVLGKRNNEAGPEFLVTLGEAPWRSAPMPVAGEVESRPSTEPYRYQPRGVPAAPEPVAVPFQPTPPKYGSAKWWEEKLPGVPSMRQANTAGIPGLPKNINVRESNLRWTGPMVGVLCVLSVLGVLWVWGRGPSTWTSQTIEQTYGDSLLAAEVSWKLVDTASGAQLYHWRTPLPFKSGDPRRAIFQGKDRASAFIRMPDGSVEPVLRLGPGPRGNEPAGGKTGGSAVAVHSGGFVLTDRRCAVPWTLPYEWPPDSFPGILIDPQTKQVDVIDRLNRPWMPLQARVVLTGEPTVESLAAGALSPAQIVVDGRIDLYRVRPRGSANWFQAIPASTSDGSEMAVAKVQGSGPLAEVKIPEADPLLGLGQRVFVLGYVDSQQDLQPKSLEFQVLKGETSSSSGSDEFALLAGTLSSINQTGSAVFDSKGRLAGLLRVVPRNGANQGEIVPIRQGRELVRSDAGR
jgi:FHA domain